MILNFNFMQNVFADYQKINSSLGTLCLALLRWKYSVFWSLYGWFQHLRHHLYQMGGLQLHEKNGQNFGKHKLPNFLNWPFYDRKNRIDY